MIDWIQSIGMDRCRNIKKSALQSHPNPLSFYNRPKHRPKYRDWKAPENAKYLAAAINALTNSLNPNLAVGDIIPKELSHMM